METGLDLIQKYTGEKAIKETYEETLLLENFLFLNFFYLLIEVPTGTL